MRIVLDANVFVSAAITPHGACGKIIKTILQNIEEFELILSERMIIETIASLNKPRIIRYLKQSSEKLRAWMEDIAAVSTIVPDVPIAISECRDPDDVAYLAAGDIAKARFIVSGDPDLLVLKRYREIDFVSPGEFIYLIKQIIEMK